MRKGLGKKGFVVGIIVLFIGVSIIPLTGVEKSMVTFGNNTAFDLNNPPDTPSRPSGPEFVCLWYYDYFSTFTTDPDGDNVSYGWDWDGDQVVDEWTGWYGSGDTCTVSHGWYQGGGYYVRVKAKDTFEYESEWSGPLFVDVGSCWPPGQPHNPDPEDGETDVDIDVILNWWATDPYPNAILTYDIYFGTNSDPPYVETVGPYLVGENTWYDPGILEYNITYYWQIVACHWGGACSWGPVWEFTTEDEAPDLECEGELNWVDVKPGGTVTGNFTVENIGEPSSELNWEIVEWPDWGTWSFIPSYGIGLMPEYGPVMVEVEVVAPDEPLSEYGGRIKIVNLQNPNDFCFIELSLITSSNFQDNFARISHQSPLLEMMKNHFPLIYQIFIEFLF